MVLSKQRADMYYPTEAVECGRLYARCPCCDRLVPENQLLLTQTVLHSLFKHASKHVPFYIDSLHDCTCGAMWSVQFTSDPNLGPE